MTEMQSVERPKSKAETPGDSIGALRQSGSVTHPATHASFLPLLHCDPARPFVVAQVGQSLDGRIATATGDSRYISGDCALDHLHGLRAHVDAVVVGIGTVLADDPQLTVRRVPGTSPVRVVIDPNGKLPDLARCCEREPACLVIRSNGAAVPDGVERVDMPVDADGQITPANIVEMLFRRGLRRILIEGGSDTISRFMDADCIDRLHVLVSPVIIGSGKPSLDLAPINALSEARRPPADVYVLPSGDVLFDCDLKG
jgi:diaminohydroxyphosphoribosylaminopyrimidine deaminase / 5-amino-6-(5-phosphoribosylamino)uracil reductase